MGRRIGTWAALALLALAIAGQARTSTAAAAGPTATPPSSDPTGSDAQYEFWLDQELPLDAAPGSQLPVAATIWDRSAERLTRFGGIYIRLHPAKGRAVTADVQGQNDWPGHVSGVVEVPAGGVGRIEMGLTAETCIAGGSCGPLDMPFAYGGVGPPPLANWSSLVIGAFEPITEPVVAGHPIDLVVDLVPRAAWDSASLGLPSEVIVVASDPHGTDLAQARLRQNPDLLTYAGTLTIPDAGDVLIVAALPVNGSADDTLDDSTTQLSVQPAAGEQPLPSEQRAASPQAGDAPVPAQDGPTSNLPLLLVIGVVIVAGGLVIGRVFADL